MFWNYDEWRLAFLIQLFIVFIVFLFRKKFKLSYFIFFLAISLVTPVPLFLVSKGVSGAVFFSDIFALYLLFRKDLTYSNHLICKVGLFLFVLWPISSSILSNVYYITFYGYINIDNKIFFIQFSRYLLFYVFFSKIVSIVEKKKIDFSNIFNIQYFVIFGIFLSILINYFGIINVDAWGSLIKYEQIGYLGRGGMFMYRGEIGAFGTICLIIFYNQYNFSKLNSFYNLVFLSIIVFTIILSGSRQGIIFSFFTLLIICIIQKKYIKFVSFFLFIIIFSFAIIQIFELNVIVSWFIKRFGIIFNFSETYESTLIRNDEKIRLSKKLEKDLFFKFFGRGIGNKIPSTESDYVNSFYYFGLIGISVYLFFLYRSLKDAFIFVNDNNFTSTYKYLPLIVSIIMPLFGFQQWYILTYGSNNTLVVYYTLFILSISYISTRQEKNLV
jgi:hypothetical protein